MKVILSTLTVLLLTACSLSPIKTPAKTTYTLDRMPKIDAAKPAHHKTLLISAPKASAAYNSRNMVYTDSAHILRHYANNTWVEPPAQLIHPLLVQALAQTQKFHAVVASPYTGRSDYRLDTQLITLQQNFATHPSEVILTLQVRLMDTDQAEVIASRRFSVAVQSPEENARGGALAANQASAHLLKQITEFVVEALKP